MGKLLLQKTSKGLSSVITALSKFGKGAGYALRN